MRYWLLKSVMQILYLNESVYAGMDTEEADDRSDPGKLGRNSSFQVEGGGTWRV